MSLKPVIRKKKLKINGKCTIFFRYGQKRKGVYIPTPWEVEPKYMLANGTISAKCPEASKLNLNLITRYKQYNDILLDLGNTIEDLCIEEIAARLRRQGKTGTSIIKYIEERIKVLRSQGRASYADTYEATIKWLKDYTEKDDINFKDINLDFLQRFEKHLLQKGKKVNTVRIYINCVTTILHHARDNEVITTDLAFLRKFRTKEKKIEKRNLSVEQFHKLLKAPASPAQVRARDLFMLSFYLCGINFKDLLYLTNSNIRKGRIEFMRFKTKDKKPEEISIKLVPEAQKIINKYQGKKYLLSFLDNENKKRGTARYKDIVKDTNKLLDRLRIKAGIDTKITTYYGRHSVGTLAYKLGIPESTISEMLGHETGNDMTNEYIERDYTKQDEAQRKIIDSIKIKRE